MVMQGTLALFVPPIIYFEFLCDSTSNKVQLKENSKVWGGGGGPNIHFMSPLIKIENSYKILAQTRYHKMLNFVLKRQWLIWGWGARSIRCLVMLIILLRHPGLFYASFFISSYELVIFFEPYLKTFFQSIGDDLLLVRYHEAQSLEICHPSSLKRGLAIPTFLSLYP